MSSTATEVRGKVDASVSNHCEEVIPLGYWNMAPVNFIAAASQHAEWASIRRTVIAANVANTNTPGYKAKDVEAFSLEPSIAGATLAQSHPAHFGSPETSRYVVSTNFSDATDEYHSGNNVSIDRELMKASSVSREQSLNAGLLKAFNRLIAMSSRG